MTIRKKLSMGIGVLMTLFLVLGVISYFQIGQIDENLAEIIQGKALGKKAVNLHQRYKILDAALAKKKDARNTLFTSVSENFAEMGGIVADKIRADSDLQQSGEHGKALEALRIEVHIAELAGSLGTFLQNPNEEYAKRIFDNAGTVEQELRQLKNLALTAEQSSSMRKLEMEFDKTMSLVKETIALGNQIQESARELGDMRAKLDELLSGDFEVFSRADIERAQKASRKMVGCGIPMRLRYRSPGYRFP